jgi:hypothetical protein
MVSVKRLRMTLCAAVNLAMQTGCVIDVSTLISHAYVITMHIHWLRHLDVMTICFHVANVAALPCFTSPCENNGACGETQDGWDFLCACAGGFTGRTCDKGNGVKIGQHKQNQLLFYDHNYYDCVELLASELYCFSNPCVHGKCDEVTGGFVCTCEKNYRGDRCSQSTCSYDTEASSK